MTTGICGMCNANSALREPPAGYDCVSGINNNN